MIHRTASVCALPSMFKHLIYQCFYDDKIDIPNYQEQLENIKSHLKSLHNLEFHIMLCKINKKNNSYKLLEQRWNNKERKLSNEVLNLIKNYNIMDFDCRYLEV